MNYNITNKIEYIGVNDKTLDLFESQYNLPNGVSYNSYILKDKKTVVMDTVDKRVTNEWLENIETTLNTYAHLYPNKQYSVAQFIDEIATGEDTNHNSEVKIPKVK